MSVLTAQLNELNQYSYKQENAARTQISTNYIYDMAAERLNKGEFVGPVLDYGSGFGSGAIRLCNKLHLNHPLKDQVDYCPDMDYFPELYKDVPIDMGIRLYEPYANKRVRKALSHYMFQGHKYDLTVLPESKFGLVVNSYVLNVVPLKERLEILQNIYERTEVGGHIIIGVRSAREIIRYTQRKGNKATVLTSEPNSFISSRGTFQHGFEKGELTDLIDYAMPEGSVEIKELEKTIVPVAIVRKKK